MAAAENINSNIEKEINLSIKKYKKNPKILIVEDDMTSQPLWEAILQLASPHARFDWATSESEAETLILNSTPAGTAYDLVISDIFLAGTKTGIDLWTRFRAELQGKMILVSSIEHEQFNRYSVADEILPYYIKKPLNISDCIETVYNILKER